MAEDFRKDPEYKQVRNRIMTSTLKGAVWGALAVGLGIGAVALCAAGGPLIIAGVVAGLGALFSAFKGWQSKIDEKAGLSEVTAERIAARSGIQQVRQPEIQQSHQQEMESATTQWAQKETQRRNSPRVSTGVAP